MESSRRSRLRLPSRVRAAAGAATGDGGVEEELAWLSWSGTVWRLVGPSGAAFVKRAAHLADEHARLAWLAGRWPVPDVLGFFQESGDDWLVTREVPGVPLFHPSVGWEPSRLARRFGEILRGRGDRMPVWRA
ncbi:MAG: phosphotransferase [Candidatus Dormibacteraceae bacterium]